MNEREANNVEVYRTKLKAKDNTVLSFYGGETWVITCFVRRLEDEELLYVVQPLMYEGTQMEGFSGLSAYALTIDELVDCFDLK